MKIIVELKKKGNLIYVHIYLLSIVLQGKSFLLGPVRFDKSSCPECGCIITVFSTHEVSAYANVWSPGDMRISSNIQIERSLPISIVWVPLWVPLYAAVTGRSSTAKKVFVRSLMGYIVGKDRQNTGFTG